MSRKYSSTFALLAFACVVAAVGLRDHLGWFVAPLIWTGVSFALLSAT